MKLDALIWGVYKQDAYKTSTEEKAKLFIKAFEDYNEALQFAKKYSNTTAIHLTRKSFIKNLYKINQNDTTK